MAITERNPFVVHTAVGAKLDRRRRVQAGKPWNRDEAILIKILDPHLRLQDATRHEDQTRADNGPAQEAAS